ncbi:MAG: sulfur reduction protein DsrE, partial [Terriglobus sp.]
MTRRLAAVTASLFVLPVPMLAQQAAPAPVPPSQKILIHVHSNDPKDWHASVDKANSIMSTAPKGSTVVEILATGDGLK